jgi:Family of unknown function (DUF5985)
MGPAIYTLCMLTSLASAYLLVRSYLATRHRLLFWSGLCFVGLAISNFVLVIDLIFLPEMDLSLWRLAISTGAIALLVFGLIWEEK